MYVAPRIWQTPFQEIVFLKDRPHIVVPKNRDQPSLNTIDPLKTTHNYIVPTENRARHICAKYKSTMYINASLTEKESKA